MGAPVRAPVRAAAASDRYGDVVHPGDPRPKLARLAGRFGFWQDVEVV